MARTKHGTLSASTVATVSLDGVGTEVEVLNVDGTAAIYFTVDGSTPTAGGDDCQVLPAIIGALRVGVVPDPPHTVKLISAGTPAYSVRVL